jgi:hypothetical protein
MIAYEKLAKMKINLNKNQKGANLGSSPVQKMNQMNQMMQIQQLQQLQQFQQMQQLQQMQMNQLNGGSQSKLFSNQFMANKNINGGNKGNTFPQLFNQVNFIPPLQQLMAMNFNNHE